MADNPNNNFLLNRIYEALSGLGGDLLAANNLSELTATAATARGNIFAAESGENSDITSLLSLESLGGLTLETLDTSTQTLLKGGSEDSGFILGPAPDNSARSDNLTAVRVATELDGACLCLTPANGTAEYIMGLISSSGYEAVIGDIRSNSAEWFFFNASPNSDGYIRKSGSPAQIRNMSIGICPDNVLNDQGIRVHQNSDDYEIRFANSSTNGALGLIANSNQRALAGNVDYSGEIYTLETTSNQVQTVAAGTAYTLTGSFATLDFGTTDPVITLPARPDGGPGQWYLWAEVQTNFVGATIIAAQSVQFKIRRTNNTPADVGPIRGQPLPVATLLTSTGVSVTIGPIAYIPNGSSDVLALQGILNGSLGAGSITGVSASITAIPR